MEQREVQIVMSETERETRRKEIIQRLLELSKLFHMDGLDNEINLQEALRLQKELLEVSPIKTSAGTEEEIKERRSRAEDRDNLEQFLEYVRTLKNKS